jgi:hypothetical protein
MFMKSVEIMTMREARQYWTALAAFSAVKNLRSSV